MEKSKLENRVSIFLPVYNNKASINTALEKIYFIFINSHYNFEIFIVDDHSSDGSYQFASVINKSSHGSGSKIRYLYYTEGPSRRENLAKSFYLATGDIICFFDIDIPSDVSYLLEAVDILSEKKVDIVIGSRYIKGAMVRMHLIRRIISFLYNLTIRIIFKSNIRDHQCGLKVFRRNVVMPIIDKMGYDKEFIRGWFWDAELLIRAQKEELRIAEIPVKWSYSDISTFNIRREIKCLKTIIKLKNELR